MGAFTEHEQAMGRYMKFSKKKDHDTKAKYEAVEDLYVYRKKFHQVSIFQSTQLVILIKHSDYHAKVFNDKVAIILRNL